MHPRDTVYYIISVVSLADGVTDVRDYKEEHQENNFGEQSRVSQDGIAICGDCKSELLFQDLFAIEPRLANHVFTEENIPNYLSVGCENTSHEDAKEIVRQTGDSGQAWSPYVEEN